MEFTQHVDTEYRLLVTRFGQVATDAGYAAAHVAVERFMARNGPHDHVLDLSLVQQFEISYALVRKIVENPVVPTTKRRIVVAPEPASYGSARVVQILRADSAAPIELVRTADKAYDLLGIKSPKLVAIEPAQLR